MRRVANPLLSSSGEAALAQYRQILWEHEDLTDASRRNYLSDLRHFAAWYEANSIRRTRRDSFISNRIRSTSHHDASTDPLSCLPPKRSSSEAKFSE